MGRFCRQRAGAPLKLQLRLQGCAPAAQRLEVAIKRKPDAVRLQCAPGRKTQALFTLATLIAHSARCWRPARAGRSHNAGLFKHAR